MAETVIRLTCRSYTILASRSVFFPRVVNAYSTLLVIFLLLLYTVGCALHDMIWTVGNGAFFCASQMACEYCGLAGQISSRFGLCQYDC
jgi:hypothetical protein